MFYPGKGSARHSFGRLSAMIVLLCSLSFLAAGRAPETDAAAMYLITETGYMALNGQQEQRADTDGAALAAIVESGDDIRLTADQPINIVQGDTVFSVTAENETVTALLERLDIKIGPMDMIAVELNEAHAEITVGSELIFYETISSVTPHEVTYITDPFLAAGVEVVEQQGQDGMFTEVYEVICHEGQEVSRQLVDRFETELRQGIVRVGAGQDAAVTEIRTAGDGSGTLVLADGTELSYTEACSMKATAYTTGDPGVGTKTATGTTVRVGTVAVDPRVIPYGTRMFIQTEDGQIVYGFGVAEDCGGSIKQNRIDLYYETSAECVSFGRRNCTVYILAD